MAAVGGPRRQGKLTPPPKIKQVKPGLWAVTAAAGSFPPRAVASSSSGGDMVYGDSAARCRGCPATDVAAAAQPSHGGGALVAATIARRIPFD